MGTGAGRRTEGDGVGEVQSGLWRCPSVLPRHLPHQTYTLRQCTFFPGRPQPNPLLKCLQAKLHPVNNCYGPHASGPLCFLHLQGSELWLLQISYINAPPTCLSDLKLAWLSFAWPGGHPIYWLCSPHKEAWLSAVSQESRWSDKILTPSPDHTH